MSPRDPVWLSLTNPWSFRGLGCRINIAENRASAEGTRCPLMSSGAECQEAEQLGLLVDAEANT